MGKSVNLDMYEGNVARQLPETCREPVYGREARVREGRREAVYAGGSRRTEDRNVQPVWKEPVSGGRSRSAERNTQNYDSRRRPVVQEGNRMVWKEPVSEGRSTGGTVRRAEKYAGRPARQKRNGGRRKKKAAVRRILRGVCFYFFLAGIIATCWAVISLLFGKEDKVHAEKGQQIGGEADLDEVSADGLAGEGTDIDGMDGAAVSLTVTPEMRQECQNLYAGQQDLLILVNKDHELSASYNPVLRSICKGRLEAADVLYDDLCAMLEDAGDAGYQYWIASAHRDRAYQQGLVDEDVQKYMAKGYTYEAALEKTYEYTMPAGQSEHETGLALDILCSTNTIMDESQKWEPGNQWLAEHCYEYGFILRYPEDKEAVTGIGYEPWHFRYVGKEAAAYLTQMGWTMEEFYEVMG